MAQVNIREKVEEIYKEVLIELHKCGLTANTGNVFQTGSCLVEGVENPEDLDFVVLQEGETSRIMFGERLLEEGWKNLSEHGNYPTGDVIVMEKHVEGVKVNLLIVRDMISYLWMHSATQLMVTLGLKEKWQRYELFRSMDSIVFTAHQYGYSDSKKEHLTIKEEENSGIKMPF